MIKEFVEAWDKNKESVRSKFTVCHPDEYEDIVRAVVQVIHDHMGDVCKPDPKRIHVIDDGDCKGTLVFVIGEVGYQPDDYWYVKVSYGSCSVCDTLERIRGYESAPPTKQQVDDYMTLALHIVQGLKKMDGESLMCDIPL